MARNKVILGSKFVAQIEREANGGVSGMFRAPRVRRTTLIEIAEEIVDAVQDIVDEPAQRGRRRNFGGLPGTSRGGRRNLNYDFRRRRDAVGTPTYRSSTSASVDKKAGKLIVVVKNDHPHAADVEYGTKRKGASVKSGKYMAIPITDKAYKRMQRNRNLSRAQRRAKGWESARPGAEWERRKKRDIARGIRNKNGSIKKRKSLTSSGLKLSKGRSGHGRSFPGIYNKDGKPAFFTRTRKNYDGYDILRRAVRTVANKRGLN